MSLIVELLTKKAALGDFLPTVFEFLVPLRFWLKATTCSSSGVSLGRSTKASRSSSSPRSATSRARLGLQGEHLYTVSGMRFPDLVSAAAVEMPEEVLSYSAVKLFLQSASRTKPGYELTADDLKYVARICRLVGGMPLGILLAAAWVDMLSPPEIAAEVERSLIKAPSPGRSLIVSKRLVVCWISQIWLTTKLNGWNQ